MLGILQWYELFAGFPRNIIKKAITYYCPSRNNSYNTHSQPHSILLSSVISVTYLNVTVEVDSAGFWLCAIGTVHWCSDQQLIKSRGMIIIKYLDTRELGSSYPHIPLAITMWLTHILLTMPQLPLGAR